MACLRVSGRVPDGEIMPMAQRAFLARLSVRARRFAKSAAGAGQQAKSLFKVWRARARQSENELKSGMAEWYMSILGLCSPCNAS
ncbi:hypothetical protein B0T45_03050 [Chromobacterium haemolyticum]|uniref:Uncharacterized protein n=1 Tax=Chromobacterium haemolyticum TaxID=394935 RepID=A0A1W0D9L6_9NEIS|nr:hypothetical protein B0T45_03050 [Chromobacterium haemolyticum]